MAKALSARTLNGQNKKVWDLFLQDWTQTEIAAEVGLSQQRVSQILQNGADEMAELPRETAMRARRAQVEANISYWAAIARDDSLPLGQREKADKRLGFWYDFRARLNAEYAPSSVYVDGAERAVIHYRIEGLEPEELK